MIFSRQLIGQNDYNKIISSDWALSGQIGDYGAVSVVYGNDVTYGECFYCCDNYGNQYSSTDGISWTLRYSSPSQGLLFNKVFYVNGRFIGFYSVSRANIHYNLSYRIGSYSGFLLDNSTNMSVEGLVYFKGKYYIAGTHFSSSSADSGQGYVRYTEDLINWSDPVYINTTNIYSMACNNDSIVITCEGGIYSTTDGNVFNKTYTGIGNYQYPKVIYAKDRFLFVELNTYGLELYQSLDGYNWSSTATYFNRFSGFKTICYGLNRYILGSTINNPSLGSQNEYAANFRESLDPYGYISSGWTSKNLNTMNGVDDIAYGNGRFVAVNGNSPYTNVCAYKLWGIE